MKGKRFVAVVITCLLVLVSSVTALAASSDQRVRQVEITVTNDKGTVAFASHEPEKYDVLLVDSEDFDIGDEEIYFDVKAVARIVIEIDTSPEFSMSISSRLTPLLSP